jgi:hypothetical protein
MVKQVNEIQKMALAMKSMFASNKTMIHIDLSYNGFMQDELKVMGEGLKDNHTILGLHMLGNQQTTDSLGYIT